MPPSSAEPSPANLMRAVKAGNLQDTRDLLDAHPDWIRETDPDEYGGTLLNLTIWREDRAMVDLLLEYGADLNQASDWEAGAWTPLQLALNLGKDDLAEDFAAKGARIGPHEAAGLGRTEKLQEILQADPEAVHQRGGDGCFPLHFARTPEVAALLLDHGADLEARDVDHHSTPLHYLCASRPETARYLLDRGAEPNIFSIIMAGDLQRLERILAEKPEQLSHRIDETLFPPHPETGASNIMNHTVGWHSTPIHAAAKANRIPVIDMLLGAGVDVSQRGDYDDCTPLHVAAWHDILEASEYLIQRGAALNQESGEIHANTPAGWAIVAGSARVLELLLRSGAEIRDHYRHDAEAAARGDFRQYKAASPEAHDRVLELLQEYS